MNSHWPQNQNDWQGRDQAQSHDETPPHCGTSLSAAEVASWVTYASDAMVWYAEFHMPFAEAMGRVVRAAKELARVRPTVAELLEDSEHAMEGE